MESKFNQNSAKILSTSTKTDQNIDPIESNIQSKLNPNSIPINTRFKFNQNLIKVSSKFDQNIDPIESNIQSKLNPNSIPINTGFKFHPNSIIFPSKLDQYEIEAELDQNPVMTRWIVPWNAFSAG